MKILTQIVNANPSASIITDSGFRVLSMNCRASKKLKEDIITANNMYLAPVGFDNDNFVARLKERGMIEAVKIKKQKSNDYFYANAGILELDQPYILWTINCDIGNYESPSIIKEIFEATPCPVFF